MNSDQFRSSMNDENGAPQNSEDESTACYSGNGLHVSITELELEIKDLERMLKQERNEKRRIQTEAQSEMEREVRLIEERWMEKVRLTIQERDSLMLKIEQLEEQLENIRVDVNRAVAYRLEMEESRNRIKNQLENVQRDYEETMAERSSVLEENTRMGEERDRLRQTVHNLNQKLNEMRQIRNDDEVQNLSNKLEHTRRLLQLNMEETASANVKRNEAIEKLAKLREDFAKLAEAKDEALRRVKEANTEREPIVDLWNTHTVEIALPFPKPNLGIVLSGGCSDDRYAIHSPIYVKEVLIGSPLEHMLKRLDHILIVNNIDVTDMDQRSVIDILKNSHHLKMVIRRRANSNKIHEINVDSNHNIGMELGNGVFVNAVDPLGNASKEGLGPGHRIVHVNHVPVYDAKHAEQLIKYSNGPIVIGALDGKKRTEGTFTKEHGSKQKPTLFSKIFGRYNSDKPRNVVAKANIGSTAHESAFYRQGSLRIPSQQQVASELVRYGSLRAPHGSTEHNTIVEQLDHFLKNKQIRSSMLSEATGSTWPKSVPEEPSFPRLRALNRPSVFPVFASQNSPVNSRIGRQPSEVSAGSCGCSSPTRVWSPQTSRDPRALLHSQSIDSRIITSPVPSTAGIAHAHRVSTYSPALPQPPPYPGPREDSLSSILSSTNSIPHPSTSSVNIGFHNYTNNSPSGTLLSEASDKGRINGIGKRGDRLLDIGEINMRSVDKDVAGKILNHFGTSQDEVTLLVNGMSNPRWVQVPRKSVRLCGGNAIGILSEATAGDLQEGDLILDIDGYNVRGATLEEATEALLESLSEMTELLIEDGGDRLNRLRLGADGDSFYVRINVDRNSENKDQLDIKAGEIVFVDKTMFMGQRGKWRAWKIDREGRQRENGIIPAATHMERTEQRGKKNKNRHAMTLSRPVFERVERVSSSRRRPVILFGALVAPFTQTLLDDSNKFAHCVPECRALQSMDVERMLATCELIEARKRDKLFDVVPATAIQNIIDRNLHCIVDISPAGIQRLHSLRIYPIVIRIKFKSARQVKDIKEDFTGEKLTTKQAKDMIDKAVAAEAELDAINCSVSAVLVSSQGPARSLLKHVCQQIVVHIEHEQKKTVWVSSQ